MYSYVNIKVKKDYGRGEITGCDHQRVPGAPRNITSRKTAEGGLIYENLYASFQLNNDILLA